MAIEKFDVLRDRFRRLKFFNELRDLQFIVQIVIACCILHNICINGLDDGMDFYVNDDFVDINNDINIEENNRRNYNDRRINLFHELFSQ